MNLVVKDVVRVVIYMYLILVLYLLKKEMVIYGGVYR